MKLLELEIIKAALPAGPALTIVEREIGAIKMRANMKKQAWNSYAPAYGLNAEDFGKVIMLRGTQYRIAGINPGAPKNAVAIVRVRDNKEFRCSPAWIRKAA